MIGKLKKVSLVAEKWLTKSLIKSIIHFSAKKCRIKVQELYQPEVAIRTTPSNLKYEDNFLFSREYVRKIKASKIYWLKNAVAFGNGCVFLNKQLIAESAIKSVHDLNHLLSTTTRFKVNANESYLAIHHLWSYNYFHWLCEVLPKLIVFENKFKTEDYTLLLPLSHKISYISDTLKSFKFKKIIYYPDKSHLLLDNLCFIGPLSQIGNVRPCIAEEIRSFYKEASMSKRKIYISRKLVGKRSVVNENEIEEILIKAGFEIINSEELTFREQVSLFSECGVLLSVHGAGLSNMLFMAPGTKVIEMRLGKDTLNNCYYSLASALDIKYYYQCCEIVDKNIIVDPIRLRQLLEEFSNV